MTKKDKSVKKSPNLRFPGFEEDWETVGFGSYISFKTTNSFSRENLNYGNGTVKNIHYGDIHTQFQTLFDVTKEKVPFIDKGLNISRISEDSFCKEGDIIFADASENLNDVGKSIEIVNLNDEKVLSGLHTLLARPIENKFEKGFLGYLLKSKNARLQIQKESQGSKVLSINAGRLSTISLSYPNIHEQKRIANFFSLLDEKISTQKKTIKQLESQIQIFIDDIMEEKLKLNGTHENWKTFEMSEIGETFNGLTGKGKENFGSGKRYIQYKQIFDSKTIKINDCGFVEISKNENQNKVKFGDAFFTISSETPNEIGMSSVLLENVEDVYLNSFSFGFRTFSHSILNPRFASFLFRSKIFRNSIVKLAQGSTRYNMSKNEFLKLKIKLPSESEQVKIFQILERISEKLETENRVLTLLEQQKKYFLQNLFI